MESVEACSGSKVSIDLTVSHLCKILDVHWSTNQQSVEAWLLGQASTDYIPRDFLFGSEEQADEIIPLGFRGCCIPDQIPDQMFFNRGVASQTFIPKRCKLPVTPDFEIWVSMLQIDGLVFFWPSRVLSKWGPEMNRACYS